MQEWKARGSRDVVRAMPTVEGPWEANILLRWAGVRLVPFLPCSGDCGEATELARRFYGVGDRHGLDVDAIGALLRLPVSFDAVGEIAIVETPLFRYQVGIDPGEDRIRGRGGEVRLPSPELNGFRDRASMDRSHAVIRRAVSPLPTPDTVIDFGCGDGSLVASIAAVIAYGVEIDPERSTAAREKGVIVFEETIAGAAHLETYWDLALLMPGRLVEMTSDQRELRGVPRGAL